MKPLNLIRMLSACLAVIFALALLPFQPAFASGIDSTDAGTTQSETASSVIDLSACSISLSYTKTTYSGNAKTPDVTVTLDGSALSQDEDYSVSYSDNTDAGTATVTVAGTGSYTGTASVTFTIAQKSISSSSAAANIALSKESYTYDGKSKKPSVTLKISLNGSTVKLAKNTDYTVSYKNNKKIGTATVTIKGTGNYKGTLKTTFTIKPAQVKSVKLSSKSFGKITVKWAKVSGSVTKYQIRYRISGVDTWIKKTVSASKLSATLSNVVPGFAFEVQVRAYKTVDGKNYCGAWSTVKTKTVNSSTKSFKSLSKQSQAKKFAQRIADYVTATYPKGTDLQRVTLASQIVYSITLSCEYTTSDSDYRTAYGVFVKGVYTCAGSTRAMGLVLDCLGLSWTHKNENKNSHQWCVVTMDGKKGYADAFVGAAGYGTWLS